MTRSDPRYVEQTYTIGEMFAAESSVSQAMRTLFRDGPSMSAGEHTVGGMSYIRENGMPTVDTSPRDSPAWQRRIMKARSDIAEYASEIRVRELAAMITVEELQNDLEEIRQWADSLRKTA